MNARALKNFYLPTLSLLALFYLSSKLTLYFFLKNYFNIFDSYLLDQLLFLFIFLVLIIKPLLRDKSLPNVKSFLIIGFYLAYMLITQNEILDRYFIKDDLYVMLNVLQDYQTVDKKYIAGLDFRYYHFLPFNLLYRLFKYKIIYYNFFALSTVAFASWVFLKLLNLLNVIHKLRYVTTIVLITLFYAVSPVIMESYLYVEHSVSAGYIITSVILSTYYYIKFLRNRSNTSYFFLSYVLMLILLKTTMTRAGFWPVCLIGLELLHWPKQKNEKFKSLFRMLLISIPFYLMAKAYILPNSGNRLYGINIEGLIKPGQLYVVIANLMPILLPYQILAPVHKYLQGRLEFLSTFFNAYDAENTGFFINNIQFTLGVILFISITASIFVLYRKRVQIKYLLFFWFSSLVSLSFYMFLSTNMVLTGKRSFDYLYLHYSNVPGHRYFPLPHFFILTTVYLILSNFIKLSNKKLQLKMRIVFNLALVGLIITSISILKNRNRITSEGHIVYRHITENVLNLVPDNSSKKVIYSTGGVIRPVTFLGWGGFKAFYKNSYPIYVDNEDDLKTAIEENSILEKDIYAFHFDEKALIFTDKSQQIREEVFSQ